MRPLSFARTNRSGQRCKRLVGCLLFLLRKRRGKKRVWVVRTCLVSCTPFDRPGGKDEAAEHRSANQGQRRRRAGYFFLAASPPAPFVTCPDVSPPPDVQGVAFKHAHLYLAPAQFDRHHRDGKTRSLSERLTITWQPNTLFPVCSRVRAVKVSTIGASVVWSLGSLSMWWLYVPDRACEEAVVVETEGQLY